MSWGRSLLFYARQRQHSGVNIGPYPFFSFHCHGLVLIFAKKDFAQFQKMNGHNKGLKRWQLFNRHDHNAPLASVAPPRFSRTSLPIIEPLFRSPPPLLAKSVPVAATVLGLFSRRRVPTLVVQFTHLVFVQRGHRRAIESHCCCRHR